MYPASLLVTGGAGYIGSHTVLQLLGAGHRVAVLDNLCNSNASVLERMARLHGGPIDFVEGDVRDEALVRSVLAARDVQAVIHFAGLKSVGESVLRPKAYHDSNVGGLASVLRAMAGTGARQIVFSSSAAVYGVPQANPIPETVPVNPANPYGQTKADCERMLLELAAGDAAWRVALLRYFNPVGAHASGLIGEDPRGVPNNLVPYLARVAAGQLPELAVYGDDYPTPDGTGVRDYIHVEDLAAGHLAALGHLVISSAPLLTNLGTGAGHSVLQVIAAFERVNGVRVRWRPAPRRDGDVAACWADPSRAQALLGWRAARGLDEMCRDAWRWQKAAEELAA